jgi:hypothetical protein
MFKLCNHSDFIPEVVERFVIQVLSERNFQSHSYTFDRIHSAEHCGKPSFAEFAFRPIFANSLSRSDH